MSGERGEVFALCTVKGATSKIDGAFHVVDVGPNLGKDRTKTGVASINVILANFWKVEVGTLEMGCDLDHSDRKAIIARAKPSLF